MEIRNYNAVPMNFEGKYVVKGRKDYIDEFSNIVLKSFCDLDSFKLKNPNKFWNYDLQLLIPSWSNEQYTECLYVTNDDLYKILKYREKKPASKLKLISREIPIEKAMKIVDEDILRLKKERQPYFDAVKKGENALADFMIEAFKKGRKILSDIFGPEDASKISIIDVNDALAAAEKGKFDFVHGKISE